MKKAFKLQYIVGLLAIIVGAITTLNSNIIPSLRYLAIFVSILVIALIILLEVYLDIDAEDAPTLDKIKDEQ